MSVRSPSIERRPANLQGDIVARDDDAVGMRVGVSGGRWSRRRQSELQWNGDDAMAEIDAAWCNWQCAGYHWLIILMLLVRVGYLYMYDLAGVVVLCAFISVLRARVLLPETLLVTPDVLRNQPHSSSLIIHICSRYSQPTYAPPQSPTRCK